MRSLLFGFVLAVVLIAAGCATGSAPPPEAKTTAPEPVQAPPVTGTASITGRVVFSGKVPPPTLLDMDSVPACARQHPKPAIEDALIIGKNGAVANAYVWIKSGLPNAKWPAPESSAHIDQIGCVYSPRIVAIQAGQGVEFTNHDPTNHNIHPIPELNAEVNRIQAPQGAPLVEKFPLPEVGVLIKCNVHPWMRAYVNVSPHPFHALTGGDGAFKINNLTDGEYVVEVWHERLGRKEVKVAVKAGESSAANFTY